VFVSVALDCRNADVPDTPRLKVSLGLSFHSSGQRNLDVRVSLWETVLPTLGHYPDVM